MIEIIYLMFKEVAIMLDKVLLCLPLIVPCIFIYQFYKYIKNAFDPNAHSDVYEGEYHYVPDNVSAMSRSNTDMFHNITTYTTNPTYSNMPSNISNNRYR